MYALCAPFLRRFIMHIMLQCAVSALDVTCMLLEYLASRHAAHTQTRPQLHPHNGHDAAHCIHSPAGSACFVRAHWWALGTAQEGSRHVLRWMSRCVVGMSAHAACWLDVTLWVLEAMQDYTNYTPFIMAGIGGRCVHAAPTNQRADTMHMRLHRRAVYGVLKCPDMLRSVPTYVCGHAHMEATHPSAPRASQLAAHRQSAGCTHASDHSYARRSPCTRVCLMQHTGIKDSRSGHMHT